MNGDRLEGALKNILKSAYKAAAGEGKGKEPVSLKLVEEPALATAYSDSEDAPGTRLEAPEDTADALVEDADGDSMDTLIDEVTNDE